MELAAFRPAVDSWLDIHHDELIPESSSTASLDGQMAHVKKVKRLVFDAGWMRWGWPERVGGLGGSSLLRAYLGEAVTARDYVHPGLYSVTEVLAPTMIDYASPELAAALVPRLLRGDESWCQGFSEPGTGSNLAALACRARRTDQGWQVNGQKVWTSLAQYADRCVLLTRTGSIESAHRGITALFVDMDSPGITVRPFAMMNGVEEFCEVFFDDVDVPADRMLGVEGQGWAVAMDLLPFERSTALWHRGAYLHQRLQHMVASAPPGALPPRQVGQALEELFAFRARSRTTQHRLADGSHLGPETSIDKLLLSGAEQSIFELAADALAADVLLGDDRDSQDWRDAFLYSKAATIYGGTAEIQRNIIAKRLLNLGVDT